MAERDSWATMNGATRVVDAEDARLGVGALLTPGTTALRSRQGIRLGPGNPGKVTATGTPDVNIHVEKFQAVLTASRGLGEYVATLDADKTIDMLTGTPAHATLVRNDLIIGRQQDTYYGDGSTSFLVTRVLGTAGAGDPSLAAFPDYIPLARVRVAATATTITTAMIDDLRPAWAVALGGTLPVPDVTARTALTAFEGLKIYRQDRDWVEIYDGAAWRVQNTAVCASTADRDGANGVTSPYNGQLATTTDTGSVWVRQGGSWVRTTTVTEAVQSAATIGMTTTLADITGVTTTFTTVGTSRDVEITATVDGESNGVTDIGIVVCVVDGTPLTGELHWGPVGRASYSRSWKTTLATAASHTIKLQGKKSGSTNTFTTYQTHTGFVVTVYNA